MSIAISAQDVKSLRERTGAGIMDAKAALQESGGDVDKAIEILRVKGQASAAKRGGRHAAEGVVSSYVHAGGQIGVREAARLKIPILGLVDTNCDPDPVDYVIPGNDDAIRSCSLVVRAIAEAIEAGKAKATPEDFQQPAAEEPAPTNEPAAGEPAPADAPAAAEEPAEPQAEAETQPEPAAQTEAEPVPVAEETS